MKSCPFTSLISVLLDSAVLQGAFLLADKLCLPSTMSSLQKADWSRVGHPVLEAVRELCGQHELVVHPWIKKVVCVVWLKLLCGETGEDVEMAWKENPFFSLQSGLPEVNRVVLLEVVKSLGASQTFSNFLLYLPPTQICTELERLVQHVRSTPTAEDDVRLFLEVWWGLWKGRHEEKTGDANIELMFARQVDRLSSMSCNTSPRAAKRFKLDPTDIPASVPTTDILHILFHALKDIKDHVSTADLCLQALSISLDALYTAFLIEQDVVLSAKQKMHILSKAASIKERNGETLRPEVLREAQRDLRASHMLSQFRPSRLTLAEALKIITELAQFWQSSGLVKLSDSSNPSYSAFKLEQSVQRVLTALPETLAAVDDLESEKNIMRTLLRSLAFPAIEVTPEVNARVPAIIISHCLEDYQNFAVLFAGEESLAACEDYWMNTLEKNQSAFQQCDALINLSATLMSKLHNEITNVNQCRKLMKVTADIFSALSLKDKNRALANMLTLSSKGFFGSSVPSSVTERFEQELHMAFNCIIQGGRGPSPVASQGNLSTAVSLVARVAFQNPEAALRSCCHSAIFNKDAFSLMANILQQLPGLRGQGETAEAQSDGEEKKEASDESIEEGKTVLNGSTVLCRCLQEVLETKSLSANEKQQFLRFLGLLMKPVMTAEGEEVRQSFLPPQEVVNMFVLPNLSAVGEYFVMCFKAYKLSLISSATLEHFEFRIGLRLCKEHELGVCCQVIWCNPTRSKLHRYRTESSTSPCCFVCGGPGTRLVSSLGVGLLSLSPSLCFSPAAKPESQVCVV